MNKMLYLSHVSWGWIKQRPHFFAEKLSQNFEVHAYPLESIRNKQYNVHSGENLILKKLVLPFHIKNISLNKIGTLIYSLIFRLQIRKLHDYKYIWITNLWLYRYLKLFIKPDQILIYDCMDDDLEFPFNKRSEKILSTLHDLEKELLPRADIIIFSSKHLRDKVIGRNNTIPLNTDKITVINNAVELPKTSQITDNSEIGKTLDYINGLRNPVVYIGTIAAWIDFSLLLKSLNNNPELNFVLIGPAEIEIPQCDRLHYLGRIQREYIFDIMDAAKALMMPFVVNELIRSVNPVKLYEYIFSGKPIFVPEYGEMEQFRPYVYEYNNENEFMHLTDLLTSGQLKNKYDLNSGKCFAKSNDWNSRCDQIQHLIHQSQILRS